MKNPIPHSNIFKTPETLEELFAIAKTMDNESQATLMLTFTINFCHALVEKEIANSVKE